MKDKFKLDDIPKHNIYQVPENYFDRLPMRVMERTEAKSNQSWLATVQWQPARMVLAPLVLLLVFLGVFYLNTPSQPAIGSMDLAALQDQEIVDYLSTFATLDSHDFSELQGINGQEITSDFLNVSSLTAEEELEYYNLKNIDY